MTLRFGLLGTGHWAREVHAKALAASPDAELVGVWGRHAGKAASLAGECGARAYDDLDALLADVDAVAVALPPDVQAPLAVRAASAGRHLLLDKPVALSLDDADRIATEVDGRGLASRVFFTARYQPLVASWLDQTRRERAPHGARGTWFGSIFRPGSPYADSEWRRRKGALWDVGPHALAVVLPLMGPVVRVTAAAGRGDTAHLVLGHEGGASTTLSLSLTVPPAAAVTEFAVYDEDGFSAMPSGELPAVEAFGLAVRGLADDAEAGRSGHPCDVRFGRDVVAVLAVCEEALESSHP